MAWSITILYTFQVQFLHSREVVAKSEMCTHLYAQKTRPVCIFTRPMRIFTVISFHLDVVIRYGSGGSRISRRGGVDSRGGSVSKILYVEMKKSGPLGTDLHRASPPLDPPMYGVVKIE